MVVMMSSPVVASTPNSDHMALLTWISAKSVHREPDCHSELLLKMDMSLEIGDTFRIFVVIFWGKIIVVIFYFCRRLPVSSTLSQFFYQRQEQPKNPSSLHPSKCSRSWSSSVNIITTNLRKIRFSIFPPCFLSCVSIVFLSANVTHISYFSTHLSFAKFLTFCCFLSLFVCVIAFWDSCSDFLTRFLNFLLLNMFIYGLSPRYQWST